MQEGRSFIVERGGADKERQYKNAMETWRQMVYRSVLLLSSYYLYVFVNWEKVKNVNCQLSHLVKKACKETQIAQYIKHRHGITFFQIICSHVKMTICLQISPQTTDMGSKQNINQIL